MSNHTQSDSHDAAIYRKIRETVAPETCSEINAAIAYLQRTMPQVDAEGAKNLQTACATLERIRTFAGKLREALKEEMKVTEDRLFYVTCFADEARRRVRYLAGPFETHMEALDAKQFWNDLLCELDPRAHWYLYGTASVPRQNEQPVVRFARSAAGHVVSSGWEGPEENPIAEGEECDGYVVSLVTVRGNKIWVWR